MSWSSDLIFYSTAGLDKQQNPSECLLYSRPQSILLIPFLQNGCIPLFLAVEAGNMSVARELLTHQREEQLKAVRTDNGETPLHVACRKKDVDICKMLVDCGANVNIKNVSTLFFV